MIMSVFRYVVLAVNELPHAGAGCVLTRAPTVLWTVHGKFHNEAQDGVSKTTYTLCCGYAYGNAL